MSDDAQTIEADTEVGSTPASEPSSASISHDNGKATAQQSDGGRAPESGEQVDRDAAAFERLAAGEDAKKVRQTLDGADPSAAKAGAKQEGRAESESKRRDAPAKAKASGQESAVYDGIDAKATDTLRRAQLLPDPESWAELSQRSRSSLLTSARQILKTKGQLSQQLGQQRQQAAAADTNQEDAGDTAGEADDQVEEIDDVDPEPAPRQQPPARTQARTTQAQTPARAAVEPGDADIDQLLEPVRGYFGDEIATPLKTVFARQQQAIAQQTQANAQLASQLNGLAKNLFLPQEREAFKELESDSGSLTPAQRKEIALNAVHFFKASADGDEPITWHQAIVRAGRSILQTDLSQQAQKKLLDRRNASLRASPSRGNAGSSRPDRALSKEDRDARAFALLSAGRSARETVAELS